jgi:hypothetical protein
MTHTKSNHRGSRFLAAAVASVGLAVIQSSPALAGLFLDLRALSVTGSGNFISADGKFVDLGGVDAAEGKTVTMGVYARVSGTNAVQQVIDVNSDGSEFVTTNDDSLEALRGSFYSDGFLKGNMGASSPGPNTTYNPRFTPFTGLGSTNGVFADFDFDGDLDLGAIGTDPTNMWCARAVAPVFAARSSLNGNGYFHQGAFAPQTQDTLLNATTSELRLGTIRFIATSGPAMGDAASIRFLLSQNAAASAMWFEDGGATARNPTNSTLTLGAPVYIENDIVPEPTAASLLGVATLGLVARRRHD